MNLAIEPRLRLRELREARGLSQVELARRLHLRSSAHISMLSSVSGVQACPCCTVSLSSSTRHSTGCIANEGVFFGRVSALSETLDPGAPERDDAKPQAKDEREECLDDVISLEELKAGREALEALRAQCRAERERLTDRERTELQRRETRDRGRFW